jgi:glutathione S-transferase
MSDKRKVIVWLQPESSMSRRVVKLMEEYGCEVEERPVNGAHWTWAQFKEASPDWSNLPAIQLDDGRILKTIKDVEAEFGKAESIHNPEPKPWAPR